jgi:hypothetical protein
MVLTLATLVAGTPAHATLLFSGVDLKSAGRTTQWALFALTGGIALTETTSQTGANGRGVTSPDGALEGAKLGVAGGGSVTLTENTKVKGTACTKRYGLLRRTGSATISSTAYAGGLAPQDQANDSAMDQVVNDTIAASAQAYAVADSAHNLLTVSNGTWATQSADTNQTTINQSSGFDLIAPDGAHIVLHLTDFVLSSVAELKLGGGSQTTYVINVTGNFSLLGGKVTLFGGLDVNNVVFNIKGVGPDLSFTSASQFNGIIPAANRTVNVSGLSKVTGSIIADKINVSGGSRVVKPTYNGP